MAASKNDIIRFKSSAPGKIILYGEHSVVYGKLALAASLGLRTEVSFETHHGDEVSIVLEALNFKQVYQLKKLTSFLQQNRQISPDQVTDDFLTAVKKFVVDNSATCLNPHQLQSLYVIVFLFGGILGPVGEPPAFCLSLKTELSLNGGTGSSASFSVALAACFLHLNSVLKGGHNVGAPNLESISEWAFQGEKIIHGTPSGLDNTICTYGGLVEYYRGRSPNVIPVQNRFPLLLINSNVGRDTKLLVGKVATLRGKYPKIVEGILGAMDNTAKEALDIIRNEENPYEKLGELADLNQNLLRALGVSHKTLDEICGILESFGLKGKLTGAGGGGYAICLVSPLLESEVINQILSVFTNRGFNATFTDLGGKGVAIH